MFHRGIAVGGEKEEKMSKNKQINEENERKLLEVFHEGQEFYSSKEVEKLAKVKGISQKQVSDTLKRLKNQNLINEKRIGSAFYYWSFPENLLITKEKQKNHLKDEMNALDDKLVTLEAELQVNNQLLCALFLKLYHKHARRKRRKMEKMGWNVTSFLIQSRR